MTLPPEQFQSLEERVDALDLKITRLLDAVSMKLAINVAEAVAEQKVHKLMQDNVSDFFAKKANKHGDRNN